MTPTLSRRCPAPAPRSIVMSPVPVHTLHPGDVVCAERGEQLETLLGSCVAVILTDPRRTVGAMCHIVHAHDPSDRARSSQAHGPVALEAMERLLSVRGIQSGLCEAYVFGGGNMFPDLYRATHVGAANADWVLRALAGRGVRVLREDLGGRFYRQVRWTVGDDPPQVRCVPV
ncbi:chemotaxis protein CheD [Hydrogenophaga pseudoflava]|uniref:chemotaxis protein CheD n=1 Tax=Hydrogenophaga pseudoflava TaxID=47421 RepID=UPI0027E45FF8|nr:chemotaxis protein CheD [Hydrogenophaga pseudoflava]MDQ7746099.1 chemotaxis protein CheD [Hydrogenophaga pseudoflava]